MTWKAHDEIVLCVDWNFSNKLIISGGEDKKYKLWDQFGRNIFVSLPYNYVTTSIEKILYRGRHYVPYLYEAEPAVEDFADEE